MSAPTEQAARAMVARAMAAQRAVGKLAAVHRFRLDPGAAVCDCPVMPVNHWYRGTELIARLALAAPDGHGARDPSADAEVYAASGADSWVIACPACRRVYAAAAELDEQAPR